MKMRPEKTPGLIIAALAALLIVSTVAFAAGEASLSATGLVMEETETGSLIRLEGPVVVALDGDTIMAGNAVVYLGENLSALEEAIESIELTDGVTFEGGDGSSGRAGQATYYTLGRRIVLRGSARFTRTDLTVSAGSVDYSIDAGHVTLAGGCRMNQRPISASSNSAEYDLNARTGSLSGSVEVHYSTGGIRFEDEDIDEVILRSDALYVSVADSEVRTPEGPTASRTTVEAGDFVLDADSVRFVVSESGIADVDAHGRVSLTGSEMQYLNADNVTLSTEDRVLRADGHVEFSVMGQEGRAESIEVNFAAGWSIRLVGASLGGTLDEELVEGEGGSDDDNG